jgi:hypothetical protein
MAIPFLTGAQYSCRYIIEVTATTQKRLAPLAFSFEFVHFLNAIHRLGGHNNTSFVLLPTVKPEK